MAESQFVPFRVVPAGLVIVLLSALRFAPASNAQGFVFDFESDPQGWVGDFADYSIGDSANWGLNWDHRAVPMLTPTEHAIFLEGDNLSDDLFFFIKRKITDLLPNRTYSVTISVDIATDESTFMIGGSDLMAKAGVTLREPLKVDDGEGYYRMNVDKGNQYAPGAEMDTIGVARHPYDDQNFHVISLDNSEQPMRITTDEAGSAWVIVGAESAFETHAKVYFAGVRIDFSTVSGVSPDPGGERIMFFPNPAGSFSTIVVENPRLGSGYELVLYNLRGEDLRHVLLQGGRARIDAADLTPGLYMYGVRRDGTTVAGGEWLVR